MQPDAEQTAEGPKDAQPTEDPETTVPVKEKKKRTGLYAAVAAVCGIALAGGIAWGAAVLSAPAEPEQEAVAAEQTVQKQLKLKVNAEGWGDASTPVIAHIVSTDKSVDTYHAFKAGEEASLDLAEGAYQVFYVSPINSDGSIYNVTGPFTIEAGDNVHESTFERIPADQVTQEQLDAVMAGIKDAVSKGDDTCKGDAGTAIVDKAAQNAAAAPNADKAKIEQEAAAAKEQAADNKPASSNDSGNSGSSSNDNASSGNSGSSASSGGSSSGGGSEPSKPAAHTHDWVYHDAQYKTVTKPVYSSKIVCSCSKIFNDTDEWNVHNEAIMLSGNRGHNYSSEKIQTGTTSEQVLVSGAYYSCSCGATK